MAQIGCLNGLRKIHSNLHLRPQTPPCTAWDWGSLVGLGWRSLPKSTELCWREEWASGCGFSLTGWLSLGQGKPVCCGHKVCTGLHGGVDTQAPPETARPLSLPGSWRIRQDALASLTVGPCVLERAETEQPAHSQCDGVDAFTK